MAKLVLHTSGFCKLVTALLWLSAVIWVNVALAEPFSLKSLNRSANQKLLLSGVATVSMIYQPDCAWCKKQGQQLAAAFEQCAGKLNIALVGAKGNARALKKELKHYHSGIPAFIADRQYLRSIGGYQASPTTVIYDANGQLIAKKRGFIAKEKLARAIDIVSQGGCQL